MTTSTPFLRVLHLEDNPHDAALIADGLRSEGIPAEITRVEDRDSYVKGLEQGSFGLIISDYTMPGFNGTSALTLAREKCPTTPFIFVSGTLGEDVAIESLKKGAANCVLKNHLERLAPAIHDALQERSDREASGYAEAELRERVKFFRQISENVTDLVSVIDPEGRRLYTSPSYRAIFGPDRLLHGTDAFAEIHPEDRERIRSLFQETVKTGVGKRAEFRFLLPDGGVHYIESQAGVIRDHDGKVSGVIVASCDVTARKTAEANLKASEERFHSVAQTANDAIVLGDSKGNIVEWNAAAQRMFGFSEKEILNKPLSLLFAPRYRGGHHKSLDFSSAAGVSRFIALALELHGQRKDGTEFPMELSLSTWKSGEQSFYSAILRDLTERKRTQELFEHLQGQNELLLNAAGDGIVGLDLEERITFANPAAAALLGRRVDELVDEPIDEALYGIPFDETRRPFSSSPIKEALKNGCVQRDINETFARKAGGGFPVEYTITPVRDKRKVTGAVLVFRDVTDRKKAEERLKEQATMLENAHDAICMIDMEARICYWNKGAEALYGWTTDEAIGKLAHKALFKKSCHQHNAAFHELIDQGKWHGELHQVTKQGREVIADSRWTLLRDEHGGTRSILIINTDVTEKKKLEGQFLRAQRLESVGRLAGGIAHDLNNILAPILMVVPMVREKLIDEGDRKLLDTVEFSAKRGADMVRQILSFARGTDGKEGAVNVGHLIAEQARIIRQTFPISIDIRTQAAADLWCVTGNATQLFQVLMNLSVNARDAMPDGGVLRIEAENVVIDREYARLHPDATPGRHVVITVGDTGTGIAPKVLKQIFLPFFSTKKMDKGTGLGLSTVQTIVRNHHGHVQIQSEQNKGTCFQVYLPASQRVAPPSEIIPAAGTPRGNGEWVLIVDNEEMVLEITTAVLEHAGYRVLTASDGTEALARYSHYKEKISLVVTDVLMPSMDGATMIQALKELNPAVKILAVTGMMEDSKVAAFVSKAKVPFLLKPLSSEKLLQCIHRMLTGAGAPLSNS
jgi:PAS domain S-box-containing protein